MEPHDAVSAAENALREAVRLVMPDWQTTSGLDVEKLRQKQTEEQRRRDGVVVSDDLLAFSELYEINKLILGKWDLFKPVFDDKKRTEVFFGVLEDVRNADAHSRSLLAFERDLLAGASGQIRNQVALYRMLADESTRNYPVIESVTDHFGNVLLGRGHEYFDPGHKWPRLNHGDQLNFKCIGWDSRERPLTWHLAAPYCRGIYDSATGSEVELSVKLDDVHVSENLVLWIVVIGSGRFHRLLADETQYDDLRVSQYSVNPPPE